jgi:hypothetical protein
MPYDEALSRLSGVQGFSIVSIEYVALWCSYRAVIESNVRVLSLYITALCEWADPSEGVTIG